LFSVTDYVYYDIFFRFVVLRMSVNNIFRRVRDDTSSLLLEDFDGSVRSQVLALGQTAHVDAEAGLTAVLPTRPETLEVGGGLGLDGLLAGLATFFLLLVARILPLSKLPREEGEVRAVGLLVHQDGLLSLGTLTYQVSDFVHGLTADHTLLGLGTHALAEAIHSLFTISI
jgi:hypothetical protein